jgi:hypothetical protein
VAEGEPLDLSYTRVSTDGEITGVNATASALSF